MNDNKPEVFIQECETLDQQDTKHSIKDQLDLKCKRNNIKKRQSDATKLLLSQNQQ